MANKKKFKKIFFLLLFILINVFYVNLLFASNLNLKITGVINNYNSNVYLKANPLSEEGIDSYDMRSIDSPNNYSSFYSNVSSKNLVIDSWPGTPRTINLVYTISESQTGTLDFSWDSLSGTSNNANFIYYGNDSNYLSAVSTINMRDTSSYSVNLEGDSVIYVKIVVSDYSPATTTSSSEGGGGVFITPEDSKNIVINNKKLDLSMIINDVKTRKIEIYNKGNSSIKFFTIVKGSKNIIKLKKDYFTLAPGEKKQIEIEIIAPEKPGIYAGKIAVAGQDILISLNVNSKKLLFDAGIVIPDNFKIINRGEKLNSQITLIPMGEKPRLDVTLNYFVKNFEGKTFLKESETILIESQKTFKKEFATKNLPPGKYILGLELVYPNSVATSSSHFEIREEELTTVSNYKMILVLLGLGILILIILIIFTITRYKNIKKLKKGQKNKN